MTVRTFHDRLTADGVLPLAIRNAVGLTDAASVYVGDRARAPRQDGEVWVEPLEELDEGADAFAERTVHRYRLHFLRRQVIDGSRAGTDHAAAANDAARLLARALNGQAPFLDDLADIIASKATTEAPPPVEEDSRIKEGLVLLELLVRGTGDELVGAGDDQTGTGEASS